MYVYIDGPEHVGKTAALLQVKLQVGALLSVLLDPAQIWIDYQGENLLEKYKQSTTGRFYICLETAARKYQAVYLLSLLNRMATVINSRAWLSVHIIERSLLFARDVYLPAMRLADFDARLILDYFNALIKTFSEKTAVKIYLKASLPVLLQRVHIHRITYISPANLVQQGAEEITWEESELIDMGRKSADAWAYLNCDYIINTDNKTPYQTAHEILKIVIKHWLKSYIKMLLYILCVLAVPLLLSYQ